MDDDKTLFEDFTDKRNWLEIGLRFKAIKLNVAHSWGYRICLVMHMVHIAATCFAIYWEVNNFPLLDALYRSSWLVLLCFLCGIICFMVTSNFGKNKKIQENCVKIGLTNKIGETPIFLHVEKQNDVKRMEFYSDGIPLTVWEEKKDAIENILNMTITDISFGSARKEIRLTGCNGLIDYEKNCYLNKKMLSSSSVMYLGECLGAHVKWNLNGYAHLLIGGATGSGKTYLLKLILYQALMHNFQVYVSDFKGGLDYTPKLKAHSVFSTNETETVQSLETICKELDRRKVLFAQANAKDIDVYNKTQEVKLQRIIFACDELAEMLSATGLSKEDKEKVRQMEKYISTIARLGRALGIHLVLATQRPDADVLNGQIKSNITYRVCGRADEMLSRIILDSSEGAKVIPKNATGVFLNQDGVVFKGYLFQEEE